MSSKKVSFLVDGFNLYHSVSRASRLLGTSTKWLDLRALCESLLYSFRPLFKDKIQLESIYYFSAYAYHLEDPDTVNRHQKFVRCLEDSGIHVEISRFKYKEIVCPHCKEKIEKYEEKETDVSIALKLHELFLSDECDICILISGDTDLAPAVRLAQKKFYDKYTFFAFPAYRKNRELANLCPGSVKIKPKKYSKFQFSDPHILQDSTSVSKPPTW